MTTATDMLAKYIAAEADILEHGQSSALSGTVSRLLTMADLEQVRAGRKEWEARVRAESRPAGSPSFPHSLASFSTRGGGW